MLLAVRNPETGSFVALCKCMSGYSDTFYKVTSLTTCFDCPLSAAVRLCVKDILKALRIVRPSHSGHVNLEV